MKISPARVAAFDALTRIYRDGAFSSIVLPAVEESLGEKDRGLCHELVLGVLRTRLKLDAAIDAFAAGKNVDLEVRIAAQIGLYQLAFLERIPDHSAVFDSVSLVQRSKKSSAKGFVNALLRRGRKLFDRIEPGDEIDELAIDTSHPRWLLERWAAQFGPDTARAIALANNRRPRLAFRFTRKALEEVIRPRADWTASARVENCYLTDNASRELRELAEAGRIYFQDEGSQLVASLATPPAGGRLLDVAAAPGSKTTMIAAAVPEAFVVAGDLHQSRVRILKANCEAQGITGVKIIRYDAEAALPFGDGTFIAVLVDAPCSGTGTIRNNPEIRYFLKESDIREFHDKQLAILRNASKLVEPGGKLVYSTCSLETEENEAVVEDFLSNSADFTLERPEAPPDLVAGGRFVRTRPWEHDMDGFFAAVFRRSEIAGIGVAGVTI